MMKFFLFKLWNVEFFELNIAKDKYVASYII